MNREKILYPWLLRKTSQNWKVRFAVLRALQPDMKCKINMINERKRNFNDVAWNKNWWLENPLQNLKTP